MKLILIVALSIGMFTGCTENSMARGYGGKESIKIATGQKVVQASWKDGDLWILTRPMNDSDVAETWTYSEKSSYGIMEGEIKLIESK
jgi:hypothetical protein